MDASKIPSFLADLTELSKKHGITIAGCGCCGSPFLSGMYPKEGHYETSGEDDLKWVANDIQTV